MIDHIDIVVTHKCNNNCPHCIDKFIHSSDKEISLADIEKFLKMLREKTDKNLEVLLLGGEPTTLDASKLIDIAIIIRKYGFSPIMSTNGICKEKIIELLPYYDWVQVTVHNEKQIEFWKTHKAKINIKLSGDKSLTMDRLKWFIKSTKDFYRRSVSMYFTPDFKELCEDKIVWDFLNSPYHEWERNGSYMYMFCDGVRYKRCIHGETNIIDEPSVPKLYPNGDYNKTWCDENLDDYLFGGLWNTRTPKNDEVKE